MELRGLCPVLACLQLLPRLVWSEAPDSTPEPLPAPTLSLSPQYPVYVWGERVTLECLAPEGQEVAGYRFYKRAQGQAPVELPTESTGPFQLLPAVMEEPSEYSCIYWVLQGSQEIPSRESTAAPVVIVAALLAPQLTAAPAHPVYLVGEAVKLRCSIPKAPAPATAQFFKDGGELSPPAPGSRPTLPLPTLGLEHAGTYTCRYRTQEAGREILSPHSGAVTISMLVPPAAPQLSVSPAEPIYLPGDSVTLTCSAPGDLDLLQIQFLRHDEGLDSWAPVSAPLSISRALQLAPLALTHSGLYSCRYWFLEARRELPSQLSGPVHILVLEPLPAPRIALAPRHPVFLPGERVTLRCSAPPWQEVARYRFYRQPRELIGAGVPDPTGSIRLDLSAGPGMAGLYVCVYWARRAGREVPSEESRPVTVSLTDHPPKPSVSLSPNYPAYVAGERVEIRCSAPPGTSPEKYGLYENSTWLRHPQGNSSTWQLDLQADGTGNATRSFSCTYEQRIQDRPVPSHTSDPVSIPVFPAPAAPSLRLIPPHPLYVTGETVTAECVTPAGPYEPRAHRLQRDEEPGAEMLGPWHDLTVTPSTRGRYRCEYSTELHGRRLQSPPSPSVVLEVTDPPPPPELSVDPPSGVVSEGAPLLLTCRAPGDTTQRRFHFYQDGAELSPPEPGASPERRFPQAAPNNSGNFTCGYEEPVGGRWILSLPSRAVNVAVAAWSLPIPLLAGCGGAAFALVLFFIVCLHRRKKEANLQHDTSYWKSRELRQSQMKRGSADNVHIGLQQKVGDWPQVSQDWGLLPKLQGEGPRLGRAAPKGHKEEDDADSGAEFEFPDGDPTYVKLNVSCSTFRQGEDRPAIPEHPYNAIAP